EVDDARHLGSVEDGGAQVDLDVRRDGLADEQALHLDREHHRDDTEQQADADAAERVPTRVAGDLGQVDADERDEQTHQRAGVFRARLPPRNSSPWLPVSATEWIDSASIDADPVIANAANFETAMPRFARKAATIARRVPSADIAHGPHRVRGDALDRAVDGA